MSRDDSHRKPCCEFYKYPNLRALPIRLIKDTALKQIAREAPHDVHTDENNGVLHTLSERKLLYLSTVPDLPVHSHTTGQVTKRSSNGHAPQGQHLMEMSVPWLVKHFD